MKAGSSASEVEVTWEDQQNINKFGRLNNRYHELEDEIKVAKVRFFSNSLLRNFVGCLVFNFLHFFPFL